MRDTLLIVTDAWDSHADIIVQECAVRGITVFRFHPSEYPEDSSISIEISGTSVSGEIDTGYRKVQLDRICSAWYRRPREPEPRMHDPYDTSAYIAYQSRSALRDLYSAIGDRWIVDPFKLGLADLKGTQLVHAAMCGLVTPRTVLTNAESIAKRFFDEVSPPILVKPLRTPALPPHVDGAWRHPRAVRWEDREVASGRIRQCATSFQPYIPKKLELRCVVIEDEVFCASIDSQSHPSKPDDGRTVHNEMPWERFELPRDVSAKMINLVKSFGIAFCSADLVLTPDNEYVFLDLNPNGQWLWLDFPPTCLPVKQKFLDMVDRKIG